ncbi:MAG: hypothetical protein WC844_05190 [Patescibacteria group bacterium]|jgi:hypothetical protein
MAWPEEYEEFRTDYFAGKASESPAYFVFCETVDWFTSYSSEAIRDHVENVAFPFLTSLDYRFTDDHRVEVLEYNYFTLDPDTLVYLGSRMNTGIIAWARAIEKIIGEGYGQPERIGETGSDALSKLNTICQLVGLPVVGRDDQRILALLLVCYEHENSDRRAEQLAAFIKDTDWSVLDLVQAAYIKLRPADLDRAKPLADDIAEMYLRDAFKRGLGEGGIMAELNEKALVNSDLVGLLPLTARAIYYFDVHMLLGEITSGSADHFVWMIWLFNGFAHDYLYTDAVIGAASGILSGGYQVEYTDRLLRERCGVSLYALAGEQSPVDVDDDEPTDEELAEIDKELRREGLI